MMFTAWTPETLREFEHDVAEAFNAGKIRAPVHLAGGNEADLIELFRDVREEDWVCGAWRTHYHCLLKGVPAKRLMADVVAGRSITLTYPEHRIVTSAIVGGVLPIALGLAWSIKRGGRNHERVWAFAGDMTARTGIFHECAVYAYGHDLPITFVVEDNGLSVCTETAATWGGPGTAGRFNVRHYGYALPWPHAGAGKRVQF